MANLKDISRLLSDNKSSISKISILAKAAAKLYKAKSPIDSVAVVFDSVDKLSKVKEKPSSKDIIVREIEAPQTILALSENSDLDKLTNNIVYDVEANKHNFNYDKFTYKMFSDASRRYKQSTSGSEKKELSSTIIECHAQLIKMLNVLCQTNENSISGILISKK